MHTKPRSLKRAPCLGSLGMLLLLTLTLAACADSEPDATAGGQEPAASVSSAPTDSAAADATAPSQEAKLNLNTASSEDFLTIPGVNDRMTHEFEEYRPYVSIRQFRQEIGKYVDEDQVAAYEQYVYVPVDPNESDAETLRQLPGVDAEAAEALVAGRPYTTREAFLEELGASVTEQERATAETYLKAP